jgi:nitrogen fixation/metabolism regulation signal transduction histidine kinase
MATAHQFRVEDDRDPNAPEKRRSWLTGCLIGCLAVVVVMVLLGIIAGIWVSRNWKGWFANSLSVVVKQSIAETDLPAEEKEQINAQIDRGAKAFADGEISGEQAARLMEKLVESPLLTAIVASAAEKKYVDPSGLSEEEKAAANVTLQRFARGVIDQKISEQTYETVMSNIATKQNDQWQLKDKVTDEELRKFLEAATKAADEAGVAEQPPHVDPSDEIKRLIDEALNPAAAMEAPPAGEPAPGAEPPPAEKSPPVEAAPAETPPVEAPAEAAKGT